MKRCTEDHHAPGFGLIPAGSLWADDSPYVIEADKFADVDEAPAPAKPKKAPARKFGAKEAAPDGDSSVD